MADVAGLPDAAELEDKDITDPAKFAPMELRTVSSRAVLCRTLRALIELDQDTFQPPFGLILMCLLQDGSGGVRRAAGRDVARVLALFDGADQPAILRDVILPRLALGVPLPADGAVGPAVSGALLGGGGGAAAGAGGDGTSGGGVMSAAARARAAETAAKARGAEDRAGGMEEDGSGGSGDGGGGGGGGGSLAPVFGDSGGGALYGGAAAAAAAAACVEETALLALGHLAAGCPAVEARCVFLLIAHAASRSRPYSLNSGGGAGGGFGQTATGAANSGSHHAALAADILSRLAAALGYRSRRHLLARHSRSVGALWIRAGLPVQNLLVGAGRNSSKCPPTRFLR